MYPKIIASIGNTKPAIPVIKINNITVGMINNIKKLAGKDTRERTPVR